MRTPRSTRQRLSGAVAALGLAATLTACGSEPEVADDPAPASSSSAAPADDSTGSVASEATDEPVEFDDGGQVDVDRFVARLNTGIANTKYAHIEFTMGGAGGQMTGSGDVDYTATPANMQMSMEIGPETMGMLLVGKTMYVQSSQTGGKYLKYDLDDPTNPLGSGLSEQLDPAASIQAFTEAVSSVTSSGEEKVDGQTLSRYVLTVDTTKLDDQAATTGLPAQMQLTVWLDDQDRMAKMSMAMGSTQFDATLSDFDERVDLQAPAQDKIVTQSGS